MKDAQLVQEENLMKTLCFKVICMMSAFVAISALGCRICNAQPGGSGGIKFHSNFIAASNFADGDSGSEVEIFSTGTSFSLYGLNIGYDYTSFTWDKANFLSFGNEKDDPWEGMHSISLGYDRSGMFDKNWGYFFNIGGASEFEKETENSFSAVGLAALVCNIPEWGMTFRIGGRTYYNPVETETLPIISIDWNTRAGSGLSFSVGVPTQVAYHFSPKTALSLGISFGENGIYRLADNSTVEEKGYLEMEGMGGKLAFTFAPFEACTVTLGGVTNFDREYTIYDKNGDNGRSYKLDDAAGGFASIGFEF